MSRNSKRTPGPAETKSTLLRQLIASGVALAIMGLGAWTLLGQQAPYHPEVYENEVSRANGSTAQTRD
jgi:hypothetical protein